MIATIQRQWWVGLTSVLGIYYLVIGVTAGGAIAIVAILGAMLMVSALALRTHSSLAASVLLVIGALPLGILTWWSLITPILAVLALICGGLAIGTGGKASGLAYRRMQVS
jgi:hypothetical protein